jgi:hypothetical protein
VTALYFRIRDLSKAEGFWGNLAKAMYYLFKNSLFQSAVPIGFSLALAAIMKSISFNGDSWFKVVEQNPGLVVWLVLFLFFQSLCFIADRYSKLFENTYTSLKHALSRLNSIIRHIHKDTRRFGLAVEQLSTISSVKRHFTESTSYEPFAESVCRELVGLISHGKSYGEIRASVFVKAREKGKDFLSSIANEKNRGTSPSYFSSRIALSGIATPAFLPELLIKMNLGQYQMKFVEKKVPKSIRINPSDKAYDSKRLLCLALPIGCEDCAVRSVLYIETDILDVFGRSKDEIEYFVETIMTPFVTLLETRLQGQMASAQIRKLRNG